jgi:hypothetical protein
MIITNPTLFYGPLPHITVPISENAAPDEFARVGCAAGHRCGREFLQAYPVETKADPRGFFGGVLTALDGAVGMMRSGGATEQQTAAWRDAFLVA